MTPAGRLRSAGVFFLQQSCFCVTTSPGKFFMPPVWKIKRAVEEHAKGYEERFAEIGK